MNYRQYPATGILRNYIRYFWSYDSLAAEASVLCIRNFADRFPRLIFQDIERFAPIQSFGNAMPACYLSGIDTKDSEALMDSSFSHFGVSFYPHALNAFFHTHAGTLTDELPNINEFCRTGIPERLQRALSHTERVKILSAYFADRLRQHSRDELLIARLIVSNEAGTASIRDLQEKYNISERQLERKFGSMLGVSPKKYQRITRFEKSLLLLENATYSELTAIAYELNYTDQSHFIKDFRAFSGMSPYEFARTRSLGSESSAFVYESA